MNSNPPSSSIFLTVSSSRYATRSHSTLPCGVCIRRADWPIPTWLPVRSRVPFQSRLKSQECIIEGGAMQTGHTFGSVHISITLLSLSLLSKTFLCPFSLSFFTVVKDCPSGGTNWRGSSQIRQLVFPSGSVTSYWVPHAVQSKRSSDVERVYLGIRVRVDSTV